MIIRSFVRFACCASLLLAVSASPRSVIAEETQEEDFFVLMTGEEPLPPVPPAPVRTQTELRIAAVPEAVAPEEVDPPKQVETTPTKPLGESSVATSSTQPKAASRKPDDSALRRSITELTIDTSADPELTAQMTKIAKDYQIQNTAEAQFGSWYAPQFDVAHQSARFVPNCYNWAAPAFYHQPLYFEQPNVERYGHYASCTCGGNCLQSAICAAHFFGTIPTLPYKMGADPCCECQYTLGTYRPGSCNPHRLVKPELSGRGLLYQGAVTTGLVYLVP